MAWPAKRRKQLAALRDLLQLCHELDKSTNWMEKVKRVVSESEKLTRIDLRGREASFYAFLVDEALKDNVAPPASRQGP